MRVYQNFITYQQDLPLYNITNENNITNLYIYSTETESKEVRILQTPKPLDSCTCMTQLPNNKLFCFGSDKFSKVALIVDRNCQIEMLPSGTTCKYSSCIYFKNNVYCFGGFYNKPLTLSSRFDLNGKRWIQLQKMPNADFKCNSIIYNGNILISGYWNRNLLVYSIDIESFTTIPYDFAEKKRKILINAGRLYLIECRNGSIYEGEIGNEYNWSQIADSTISYDPSQAYCINSQDAAYIGLNHGYFKFDLNVKRLIALI